MWHLTPRRTTRYTHARCVPTPTPQCFLVLLQMAAQMKAMQSMMQKPEVQREMQEMAAYLQNQQLQKRLEELKDDPELAGVFEDIKKNGPGAMMKYWNDPNTLAKLGAKLGDIQPAAAPAAAAARPLPGYAPPAPEVTNLLEAAR
jgi:hypothetical protein